MTETKSPSICPRCGSGSKYHSPIGYDRQVDGLMVRKFHCYKCNRNFPELTEALIQKRNRRQKASCVLELSGKIRNENELSLFASISDPNEARLVELAWRMKNRGLERKTIWGVIHYLLVLISKGAKLEDVTSVENLIATDKFTLSQKYHLINSYRSFTDNFGIQWTPLKSKYQRPDPFIPLEQEIDLLITGCGKVTSTFLQIIKDTGARPGEVAAVEWSDVNFESKTISINHPLKGSRVRTVSVTPKSLAMLNLLPKKYGKRLFTTNLSSMGNAFRKVRIRLAKSNPRLTQISFRTLRHWKATMEYAKERDPLKVQTLLGHKSILNTMIYTHLIDNFKDEEWTVRRARTPKEEDSYIEAGFQYVRYDEQDHCAIYRRRK